MNSNESHGKPTVFSRTTTILNCRDNVKWKRLLTFQTSTNRNQTKNLLNCKYVLAFYEKDMTQKAEPSVMKWVLLKDLFSICPGGFQNCYRPLAPLYLLFSPIFTGIYKRLSSICPIILFRVCVGWKTYNLVHMPID